MENLTYRFSSKPQAKASAPVLVGVTASGNCEVLLEASANKAECAVQVQTSAIGFAPVWQAVLTDFAERHAAGGISIEIHDVGATPAVVSLRLGQAIEAWETQHG